MKNQEDFGQVYLMEPPLRHAFERLYGEGRDCADDLAARLGAFNFPEVHPTLTDYIQSLENCWLYTEEEPERVLEVAEKALSSLESKPWSVRKMIELTKEQLKLMEAVRNTIATLRTTRIYRIENGLPTDTEKPWWQSFDRRIAVLGLIATVIGLYFGLR